MRVAFPFLMFLLSNLASAQPVYEMRSLILLQPESVLEKRISAQTLVPYVQSLNATASKVFARHQFDPAGGFLVVAVKAGSQSAVWLDIRVEVVARFTKTKPELLPTLAARISVWEDRFSVAVLWKLDDIASNAEST